MEYQIQANSRRCAVSGRELRAGERFYSVLLDEGGRLIRRDFAPDAWAGPPSGAFSFWCGRVPATDRECRPPIDDALLLECFERLADETEPGRLRFRYVVALLLMRRRQLRYEATRIQEGQEFLILRCPRTAETYEVVNPRLTAEELTAVQEEVFQVLGWQ